MAAIPLVRLAHAVAIVAPLALLCPVLSLGRLAPVTLIGSGMRGGISIALAPSLPDGPARPIAAATTYAVVLFSASERGSTIERLLASDRRDADPKAGWFPTPDDSQMIAPVYAA